MQWRTTLVFLRTARVCLALTVSACGGAGKACEVDGDCRGGFACLASDTGGTNACAQTCTSHAQCAVGFECDLASGPCVESDWCTTDDQCTPYMCAPHEATLTCFGTCGIDEATGCYTSCTEGCADGYGCPLTGAFDCQPD